MQRLYHSVIMHYTPIIVCSRLCRFWLVESAVPSAVVEAAQRVYAELCVVPFIARFAAFSRRVADDQVCLPVPEVRSGTLAKLLLLLLRF